MSLKEAYDHLLPLIESELRDIITASNPGIEPYFGMMRYHLGWADEKLQPIEVTSGKRLRPMICLLVCQAVGGDPQPALPASAAVELIHNFSLVHDDIQDESHYRRGRRAVWDIWGEAQGINVGDGLFALARLALHRLDERRVPPSRFRAAALALDRACLALCEGQFFDMAFERRVNVDLDQYLWMIRHKTGALLASSAQLGAIIATDDEAVVEQYYRFGANLGLAFQIQDDILGTWGDERLTGKSAAIDIRDRKKTLPVVYVLNHPDAPASARKLADLFGREGPLEEPAIQVALDVLDETGARAYAEEMASDYYRVAIEALDNTKIKDRAQVWLRELAAALWNRQA